MAAEGITAFEGRWQIARRIEDRRAGVTGRFEGTAKLTPGADGLWTWQETGTLRMGPDGPALTANRRYLWQPEGARIVVLFDDGRYFHGFDPQDPQAAAHHDCPPDVYDVTYDFTAWPQWTSTWEVRGPRKDYRMESLHSRG